VQRDRIHDGHDEDEDDDVMITITREAIQLHAKIVRAFLFTVSHSALGKFRKMTNFR